MVNLAVGVGSSVNKRDIINSLGKNETSYLAISGSKRTLNPGCLGSKNFFSPIMNYETQ